MTSRDDRSGDAVERRRRAEEMARGKAARAPEDIEILSPEETRRTLHELRVHQIELELQNEELRRAQEDLEIARARYFDLYDLAPAGYCTISEQGLILEANLTAAGLLGVARGALIQKPITRFILKEDQGIYYLHRNKLFETGEPQERELRMVKSDGTAFWAHLAMTAAEDAGGAPVCRVVMSDVPEREREEEALRESEERYRRVSSAMSDIAYSCCATETGGYMIDWLSGATERITGYSADELRAMRCWSHLVIRKDLALFDEHVVGLAPGSSGSCELRIRHKEGSVRWLASAAECVLSPDVPRTLRIYGGLVDITERKALEGQFQQAQKMESVGCMAGGMAHDFNNLLTVINGYSQLLLAKLGAGDPLRASLGEIYKAGERAAGLTRQLLAFSRKQVLEPRRLNVNHVVEEMRPMLERLAGEAVEVRVELESGSVTVHADPSQLEQVIMNLTVNARDAMPDGGRLLIETACVELDESNAQSNPEARAGRYVMLAVSDNGTGMDAEIQQRIFDPFFTTKEVGKGTGLGLSMVQGVVAQSGGFIYVYSEKGQGTTFKIYLPAVAESAADAERPAAVPALGGKETVLVVEDRAEVREYTVKALSEYGYRVIEAENALVALLLCELGGASFDLVLTDLVMPNVSGRQLASRLEKLRPGIKVLFMSGYPDDVIMHHGALGGGAQFIQKPFSPEELAGKVREVLGPPAPAARIVVADDEAEVRGFLRAALEQAGYEVIEAANGKQALQQARAGDVDLVITDLIMPEQEGLETTQALRREVPGVGIIVISGAFGGQFLKVAQMLGADAVLTKPVGAELLLARVAEVLKQRR